MGPKPLSCLCLFKKRLRICQVYHQGSSCGLSDHMFLLMGDNLKPLPLKQSYLKSWNQSFLVKIGISDTLYSQTFLSEELLDIINGNLSFLSFCSIFVSVSSGLGLAVAPYDCGGLRLIIIKRIWYRSPSTTWYVSRRILGLCIIVKSNYWDHRVRPLPSLEYPTLLRYSASQATEYEC